MTNDGYFISGTDTGVGKTWATVALMRALQTRGLRVAGMKPVAAGCCWLDGEWKNEDALLIQRHASVSLSYRQVNPYAFEMPVSPHLAAGDTYVDAERLIASLDDLKSLADVVLVEGAGGWLSPLSVELTNAALAEKFGLPVVLVVGMRLGCINHGLLTWGAIRASGVACTGWVAVSTEAKEMPFFQENIDYLRQRIEAPLVGVLPYQEQADFDLLSQSFCGNLQLT